MGGTPKDAELEEGRVLIWSLEVTGQGRAVSPVVPSVGDQTRPQPSSMVLMLLIDPGTGRLSLQAPSPLSCPTRITSQIPSPPWILSGLSRGQPEPSSRPLPSPIIEHNLRKSLPDCPPSARSPSLPCPHATSLATAEGRSLGYHCPEHPWPPGCLHRVPSNTRSANTDWGSVLSRPLTRPPQPVAWHAQSPQTAPSAVLCVWCHAAECLLQRSP